MKSLEAFENAHSAHGVECDHVGQEQTRGQGKGWGGAPEADQNAPRIIMDAPFIPTLHI